MATINELKGMASSKLGFARSNNFLVELPPLGNSSAQTGILGGLTQNIQSFIPSIPGLTKDAMPNTRELNVLCKGASLPGKQILTVDRRLSMQNDKIAYGYAVVEVNLSFYLLNDYSVKNYFDEWMSRIISDGYNENGQTTYQTVKYKSEYALPVKIHQLRKPQVGFSANLGPITGNLGIGGGSVYTVELFKAFPTTVNEIQFTNDQDGLVELGVTLSYTNWKRVKTQQNFIDTSIGF